MEEQKVSFVLAGPAKVDGERKKVGAKVSVSRTLALQLAASGSISPGAAEALSSAIDQSDTLQEGDFQQAVEDAAADRIEVLKVEHDLALQKMSIELGTKADASAARVTELEKLLQTADGFASGLTSDLAAATKRAETAEAAAAEVAAELAKEQKARADVEKQLKAATKASTPAK